MTTNEGGQYLDIVLSCVLVVQLFRSGLYIKYLPFLVFTLVDSLQSSIYIALHYLWLHGIQLLDYRLVWCSLRAIAWLTTIWMVYALLIAILKQLPGILRFSLRFLNIVIALSVMVALITIRPEYDASKVAAEPDWRARFTELVIVLERAFSFAELLVIVAILIFVMFFPIRVPRNLAAFTAGVCIYLCCATGWFLGKTYLPGFFGQVTVDWPPFVLAACLIFWNLIISPQGEMTGATLGRHWQSLPKEHLIHQLQAMDAALLRSREQS